MKPQVCCRQLYGARAATVSTRSTIRLALKTARSLVGGYGGPRMPTIMQALHRGAPSSRACDY